MGAWGPGLYSDDFAADLKTTVGTLCRLPFSGEEVVEILVELNPAASNSADEEHTTFWLVVADQFQRRGIDSHARDRAVSIIREEANLHVLADLGMTDADLRKRASNLDELLERLEAPPLDKDRRTIKKPQPLVVEPGDVFRYRVDSQGNVYNPYFTRPDQARFNPVAWGSCMVISSGHAFDFLAWFQIAPSLQLRCPPPSLEQALRDIDPGVNNVGTLSSAHLKRMNLELIGRVDPPVVAPLTSERITDVVASDISVSNILSRWLPSGSIGQ